MKRLLLALLAFGLGNNIALPGDGAAPAAMPVVKRIDSAFSYSGKEGELFSYRDRFYQVAALDVSIRPGTTNVTLGANDDVARDIARVVGLGILTNRPVAAIALGIPPAVVDGRTAAYAVRNENGLFSLHDRDGLVVLGPSSGEELARMGVRLMDGGTAKEKP